MQQIEDALLASVMGEVVYVLLLYNSVSVVKYVSIESAENANAERVKKGRILGTRCNILGK